MKLQDLKIGDKITHYCSGAIVEGTVIEINENGVITEHEPVQWGKDTYTKTGIHKSTYLQAKWANEPVTPKSWYNGKPLTA